MTSKDVLRDQGRGLVGALLLGASLLFTMELWILAERLPVATIGALAMGGSVIIVVAVHHVGFREAEDRPHGIEDHVRQVTELVLQSVVAGVAMLLILGVLAWGDPPMAFVRAALVCLVPLGLGAALANTLLTADGDKSPERSPLAKRLALFAVGALFFCLPIAPTQEVARIASLAGWPRLGILVAATMLLTYLTLYELEFRGQAGRVSASRWGRVGQTALVYWVGLGVSAAALAGFGQLEDGFLANLQYVIVLGFPAAMGGAAAQVVL